MTSNRLLVHPVIVKLPASHSFYSLEGKCLGQEGKGGLRQNSCSLVWGHGLVIKGPDTKLDSLNLIPVTHTVGENPFLKVVL